MLVDAAVAAAGPTVETSSVARWQMWLAWTVVILLLVGFVVASWIFAKSRFDEDQKEELRTLRPQFVAATPNRYHIQRDESLGQIRAELRGVIQGNPPEQTRVGDAVDDVRVALDRLLPDMPRVSAVALIEAVILLALVAVVAIATVGIDISIGLLDIFQWALLVLLLAWTAATATFEGVLSVLPDGGVIGSILAGSATSNQLIAFGALVALLLLVSALVEVGFSDEIQSAPLVDDRKQFFARVGVALLVVGGIGALSRAAGQIALGVAVLVGILLVLHAARRHRQQATEPTVDYSTPADTDALVPAEKTDEDTIDGWRSRLLPGLDRSTALLTAHGIVNAIALLSWIGVGVVTVGVLRSGYGTAAIAELVSGGPLVWLALAILAGGVLATLSWAMPDETRALRNALQRAANCGIVRIAVLKNGIPVFFVMVSFLIVWSFTPGSMLSRTLIAGIVAIAAGLIARGLMAVYHRIRHRYLASSVRSDGISEVVVEGYTVEDSAGDAIYVIEVDGRGHAHRDPDELIEQVTEAIHYRQHPEDYGDSSKLGPAGSSYRLPTLTAEYYDALERGEVDFEHVLRAEQGDVRTRVKASLREARNGSVPVEAMHRELGAEYPEPILDRVLDELRHSGEIVRQNGVYRLRNQRR